MIRKTKKRMGIERERKRRELRMDGNKN